MKKILIIITLFATTFVMAQNKNAKITIEVDGVCKMCKKRIEKACIKTKGVKFANWSVETHQLKLIVDERKTTVEKIQKSIAAAGHDTKAFKASDEAYAKLHHCCKYREEDSH